MCIYSLNLSIMDLESLQKDYNKPNQAIIAPIGQRSKTAI